MSSGLLTIFPDNDNIVIWKFAERASDGAYVNDATITMSLFAPDVDPDTGTPVTNAANVPMNYVANSNGEYQGVLPYTLALTAGAGYHLRITATGTVHAQRTLDTVVVERTT